MDEYKKYSLEQLENWVHDAMSSDATPQEIYDTIKNVVQENYYIYKNLTSQAYELLALLNGNGKGHLTCDKDDPSPECKGAWDSFWEDPDYPKEVKKDDCMPPWGHSDMEALRYTEKELNAMCDKAEEQEKHSKYYYDYSRNDINRKNPFKQKIYESPDGGKTVYSRELGKTEKTLVKEEETKKWILPIGKYDEDNYYVSFPDELLKAADLKEGDIVEWIDNGNGSFSLKKASIMHHAV